MNEVWWCAWTDGGVDEVSGLARLMPVTNETMSPIENSPAAKECAHGEWIHGAARRRRWMVREREVLGAVENESSTRIMHV